MLQHAGLDDAQLGPRLVRLLAPDSPLPAREMVARGLAPLAGAEPWLALYQSWVRGGATLADQASRTASDLPAAAVVAALADPHLPAVVLDFMARRRLRSPDTLRLLVHHPRVADPTLQTLARAAPTPVCDALAHNQRRWLACPDIAIQLVHNPHCDRATAHAVLELGAREDIAALVDLRREALAGSVLQDSPEVAARLAAWLLRGAATDPLPAIPRPPATVLPARHGGAPNRPNPGRSPWPAEPLSAEPARPASPNLSPGTATSPAYPSPGPASSPAYLSPGPARPATPNLSPGTATSPAYLPPGPAAGPSDLPPGPAASPSNLSPGPARPATPNLSLGPAASPRPNLSPGPAWPAAPNLSPGPATSPRPNLSPGPAWPGTAAAARPTLSPGAARKPGDPGRPPPPPVTRSVPAKPPALSTAKPTHAKAATDPPAPPSSPTARPSTAAQPALPDLSSRPAAGWPAPNPRPAARLDLTPPAQLEDDADELDLPIADGWDEALGPGIADIPPPAPRSAVPPPDDDAPLPPPPPRKPEQRLLFSDALDGAAPRTPATAPTPPSPSYTDRVARVLDPRTPLTLAMSLLHRLRPADLRRVAAARHLAPALVAAARRRVPRADRETRPR